MPEAGAPDCGAPGPASAAVPPPTQAAGTGPEARVEFALLPEDLPVLLRQPGLARTARPIRAELSWHDTPAGELASDNRALCHVEAGPAPGGPWRLEALYPSADHPWPPAGPAPILHQADSPGRLQVPEHLAAIAAFRGRCHQLAGHGVRFAVLEGHLRGVTAIRPACRVVLHGPSSALTGQVEALGAVVRLAVPVAGLAAEAVAAARGTEPYAGPDLPTVADGPLTDAVALVIGGLLRTMLHWSATAGEGIDPLPVHQMRVATRRLRSALSIFRHAAACPEVLPLGAALRETASQLGAARDWDVFLAGTGAQVADLFPGDPRVQALLSAGRRRRKVAYAELRTHLASPAFRSLALSLACAAALRPWEGQSTAQDAMLQSDARAFGVTVLDRRLHRVRKAGRGLRHLPVPALHELRKDCKRLRYAAEFFFPLFEERQARRYIRRLSALQEVLGLLNDGAAAAGLLGQLGRGGGGYAAGLVNGYVAAGAGAFRRGIQDTWQGFRHADAFWA